MYGDTTVLRMYPLCGTHLGFCQITFGTLVESSAQDAYIYSREHILLGLCYEVSLFYLT